jgi:hypothetical protein
VGSRVEAVLDEATVRDERGDDKVAGLAGKDGDDREDNQDDAHGRAVSDVPGR